MQTHELIVSIANIIQRNHFTCPLPSDAGLGSCEKAKELKHHEVVVAITAGKLDFGRWEQIFYGEFDGKRRKRVLVKIIGE